MNSVAVYYFLFFAYNYSVVEGLLLNGKLTTVKRGKNSMKMILRNKLQIQYTPLNNIIIGTHNVDVTLKSKVRVKRQSGAGKLVEVAQMPQIKLVRLFLQMFKNIWDDAYIGGSHPLHPNVPKVFVKLFKPKIIEFFIPDIKKQKGS